MAAYCGDKSKEDMHHATKKKKTAYKTLRNPPRSGAQLWENLAYMKG
jgi:hypothetical protein